MRRRTPATGPDPATAARIADDARWWAARAQQDRPLTVAEFDRFRALVEQSDDSPAAVDAILTAGLSPPAVAASISAHMRARCGQVVDHNPAYLDAIIIGRRLLPNPV